MNLTTEDVERYTPYHTFPEFAEGYADYRAGLRDIGYDGVAGQAYDRGAECAMRHKMQELRSRGREPPFPFGGSLFDNVRREQ